MFPAAPLKLITTDFAFHCVCVFVYVCACMSLFRVCVYVRAHACVCALGSVYAVYAVYACVRVQATPFTHCGTCDNCVQQHAFADDKTRDFSWEVRLLLTAIDACRGRVSAEFCP